MGALRRIGKSFDALSELVTQYSVVYGHAQFPLHLMPDGMFAWDRLDGAFDGFSKDGLTYLCYRLMSWEDKSRWIDRQEARELYARDRAAFVRYVNNCRNWQVTEERKRKDEILIASYLPTAPNGSLQLWGLLTDYNPVPNTSVLCSIGDLKKQLFQWSWEPMELNLYFETGYCAPFAWGLCIRNGETGHATLGYHFYVHAHGSAYFGTTPFSGARRHLSLVDKAITNISSALAELRELEFDNVLYAERVQDYITLLPRSKFEKVYDAMRQERVGDESSMLDLLSLLSALYRTRGTKTIAKQAMDILTSALTVKAFS